MKSLMPYMSSSIPWGIFLLLCSFSAQSATVWNTNQSMKSLSQEFSYFCQHRTSEHPSDPSQLKDDTFVPRYGPVNLGYSGNEECWVQLEVDLEEPKAKDAMIEFAFAQADIVQIFQKGEQAWDDRGRAGHLVAMNSWPVEYRQPVFPITLQPGLNIFRVYHRGSDISGLNFRLWEPRAFQRAINWEALLFGGFFAVSFGLALYNIGMYIAFRKISHFYYFVNFVFYVWSQMYLTGHLKVLVLQDVGSALPHIGLFLIAMALFTTYRLVGSLLEIDKFERWQRLLFHSASYVTLIIMPLSLFAPIGVTGPICLFVSSIGTILVIGYGVQAYRIRIPMAPLFLWAWGSVLLGSAIQIAMIAQVIPDNPFTRSANFLGASLESIIISIGLASRMRRERFEEVQRRKHAFCQLAKMVYPHQLKMMQDGSQLEETMPLTEAKEVCVICVDMVNSSKFDPQKLKVFLRDFFDACQDTMNQDYNGDKMQASGFRIKEMGDGFLCSVGFPFHPPYQQNIRALSLKMADNFVQNFAQCVQRHQDFASSQPLLAIGIADGPIEGFFSLAGIRSYELFGRSIILSTRYEALRKLIELPGQGHLICLRSNVFLGLPDELKQDFERVDLSSIRKWVRDDEDVREFYFKKIPVSRQANGLQTAV